MPPFIVRSIGLRNKWNDPTAVFAVGDLELFLPTRRRDQLTSIYCRGRGNRPGNADKDRCGDTIYDKSRKIVHLKPSQSLFLKEKA
jgi:hypothetical protein